MNQTENTEEVMGIAIQNPAQIQMLVAQLHIIGHDGCHQIANALAPGWYREAKEHETTEEEFISTLAGLILLGREHFTLH